MLYEEWWYLNIEEYERITFELRVSYDLVESLINNFWLFEKDDSKFWSNSVLDRLKQRMDKSEKARISVQKRWDKKKEDNTNVIRTYNDGNTIKERKGKEIKEKENNTETDTIVSSQAIVPTDNRNKDINDLLEVIKGQVEFLGFIYKKWKYERERAKNILTGKDFWAVCERAWMSRVEFCKNIIYTSTLLTFWNWKINNAETLYEHYAKVYNDAVNKKTEMERPKSALDITL